MIPEYKVSSLSENNFVENKNNDINLKVQNVLKKALKKEGFINYNINVKPISTNGGNFMGELYEIDITGATKEGKKEINIFMKKIIEGANMILLNVKAAHNRELFFYKELQQIFDELQNEAGVPENEKYRVPKSFSANDPDVIMLENVSKKSYKTYDRMDVVSLEFAEACMEQIAKFHALSFVLEIKRPEYYSAKVKTLTSLYSLDDGGWDTFFKKVNDSMSKLLNVEQKEKLKKFIPQIKEHLRKYVMDVESVKCCLCHGDFRPNNIMMKETNGVYSDIIPVDYQIMHYASPINEFLFFIVVSTDGQFRRKYMTYLKDFYLRHLRIFLQRFGIDVETVYPKAKFETDLRERMGYGIVFTYVMAPFLYAPEDDLPDFRNDFTDIHFSLDDSCRDRVRDLISDFIEWSGL